MFLLKGSKTRLNTWLRSAWQTAAAVYSVEHKTLPHSASQTLMCCLCLMASSTRSITTKHYWLTLLIVQEGIAQADSERSLLHHRENYFSCPDVPLDCISWIQTFHYSSNMPSLCYLIHLYTPIIPCFQLTVPVCFECVSLLRVCDNACHSWCFSLLPCECPGVHETICG